MMGALGRQRLGTRPTSQRVPVPAPYGGMNTRDSLDSMSPTDAVSLRNWDCDVGKVRMRKGRSSHATGVGTANVDSMVEYHAASVRKLIASANGKVYDATSAGAATQLGTGYSADAWEWANFNGKLLGVNGADTPLEYDGTTLSNSTLSGSGLTPANLDGIAVHKGRVYRWDSGTQDFWYSSANAVAGTVVKFPLSRVSQFGGNLTAMISWTVDAGVGGADDFLVAIMSSGDCIVYSGSDPGDASNFSLVGIYRIGAPIDKRAMLKLGGDVLIATNEDYVSLSDVLRKGRLTTDRSKMSGALVAAYKAYKSNAGWGAVHYPRGNRVLFNIPVSATLYDQHVLNTITGAWTVYGEIPARSWVVFNDLLYLGSTDGTIYKADDTNADAGATIKADGQPAWSQLGYPGRKRVVGVRPVLASEGSLTASIGLGYDYAGPGTAQTIATTAGGTAWGSAWGSPWSPATRAKGEWRGAIGEGQDVAFRLQITTSGQEVEWHETTYLYEPGQRL